MQKPFTGLHFELTNQCNLRCTHCYNIDYLDSSDDDIDIKTIKKSLINRLKLVVGILVFQVGSRS